MNAPHTCPKCAAALSADAPEGLCPACLMQGGFATDATIKLTPSQMRTPSHGPIAPPTEEIAPLFPQLEIIELLGRGGMGAVYKARQPKLNRFVALKIIAGDAAADPHFAERFQREAQALAKLNHPNIVSVFDFGESSGLFYFLMEYVDGANLRTLIRGGEMKPEAALALIPAFCDALQYAHDEGVVHRDIKPENVLVDKKGRVKIADFGLAKLTGSDAHDHTLTRTGMYLGTPRYMAPEQVEKPETVDHRADIYSLGVVFYEMLTGELPMGRFDPPSKKVQVDVKLDDIVLHALEKEPARRYQHASEIKTDVQSVASKPVAPQTPGHAPASPVDSPAKRLGEIVMLELIVLCATSATLAVKEIITAIVTGAWRYDPNANVLWKHLQNSSVWLMLSLSITSLILLNKSRREGQIRLARVTALFLAGAWMLGLWSHDWAWLGTMVSLVVWHLLGKPDVQESFRALGTAVEARAGTPTGKIKTDVQSVAGKTPVQAQTGPLESRLSRCALWGAIFASAGIASAIVAIVTYANLIFTGGNPAGYQTVIALCVGFLVHAVATTVLGGIGIAHIKRAGGKLHGLPLAFADTIFFPLLFVHGAMAVLLGLLILTIMKLAGVNAALGVLEMGLLAMLPLFVDFFIVRALWRKVAGRPAPAPGDVCSKLNLAGIGLLLAGIADAFAGLFWAGQNIVKVITAIQNDAPVGWLVVETLLSVCILSVVYYVIGAALFLMRREDKGDITFPLIIAAIVPPGCFVGLPAAIYAFVLLSKPEVKALFPQDAA